MVRASDTDRHAVTLQGEQAETPAPHLLVKGVPLSTFCDNHSRLRLRLQLHVSFVCDEALTSHR